MDTVWEQVIGNAKLISLPEAYLNLKKILDQEDYSMAEVAVAINHDPALTARLLKVVNSPLYGFLGTIDSVFRAVTLLGTQPVHDLALATSVSHAFKGMDNSVMSMSSFWSNSVYCGLAAKNLAIARGLLNSERLFIAGLLHDIGHLVMYQSIPDLCQQAILQAKETKQPLYLVERDLTGVDYVRVTSALLRQWLLPVSLRETIEFHLTPEQSLTFLEESNLLNIATKMTLATAEGVPLDSVSVKVEDKTLELSELTMEDCITMQKSTENDVVPVLNSIFPIKKAC